MTRRGRHWRLYDSEIQKGGKPLLYYAQYDSEANTTILYGVQYDRKRQTLPSCIVFNMTERGKHYHLVWCSIWPKEANTAILCEDEVDTERQTLPSRVVLNMTQRGNHCRLVWCWIRPRCKLRWKYVKRWWEGCPGVVSRNGDIREIFFKSRRWAFARISTYVLWGHGWSVSFCPIPGQIYSRETTDSSFFPDKNPTFVCLC